MDYLKRKFSLLKATVTTDDDNEVEDEDYDDEEVDDEDGGFGGGEDEESDSPMKTWLKFAFDFLENHRPNELVWCYHIFLLLTNLCYMAIILIENSDGPNYYADGGRNAAASALYPTLPTFASYYGVKLFLTLPLLIH